MARPLAVLLAEDREDDALLVEGCLISAGYDVQLTRVTTAAALNNQLASGNFDVVMAADSVSDFTYRDVSTAMQTFGLDTPFIPLLRNGADGAAANYVRKDDLFRLPFAIEREQRDSRSKRELLSLEARLEQALKAEAMGKLASGVAHDFNNLLTVIAGFAQLALMDDNPARAGLEQILLATERASSMTRRLVTFGRQEQPEPRVFEVNQMVSDLAKMLRRLIEANIEVVAQIAPEPITVLADPGRSEQLMLTLATHSRDAMRAGGRLTMSSGKRRLDGPEAAALQLPEGDYCAIAITDTGDHPSSVDRTAEAHFIRLEGGAIQAEETVTGTDVTLFLPVHGERPEIQLMPTTASVGRGSETVLVAEDDSTVLQMVCQCLTSRGFRVLPANSGEEAIALVHAQGPAGVDLLIADILMPGISGATLVERVSELLPLLKVLFMSGHSDETIQAYGVSRTEVDFLRKPFGASELVNKVRRVLDRKTHGEVASTTS